MVQQTAQPVGQGMAVGVETFDYEPVAVPAEPSWEAFESVAGDQATIRKAGPGYRTAAQRGGDETADPSGDPMRAEEIRRSFEAGRERGFMEGQAAQREAAAGTLKAQEAARAEQIEHLVEGFQSERFHYFEAVEHEVVKLAMAIAARILRREAHVDPLLLSGSMRAALGQLSAATQVRLQVPPEDIELWTDAVAHMPKLSPKPTVVAGKEMQLGECVLETELGSVDLGIAAQLGEIESGFFDRSISTPALSLVGEEMTE